MTLKNPHRSEARMEMGAVLPALLEHRRVPEVSPWQICCGMK